MALNLSTTVRTALAQAIITAAGASAKLKFYSGTRPAGVAAVGGGTTLHATGTFGSAIGIVNAGTIDWDEAGYTQTPSGFTAGTPTFVDVTTSADAVVARLDLGSGSWGWTGTVAVGQPISLINLVWTVGA